jgi:hypothetical protein
MSLDRIVRFLLPKEDHFYDFLEQQAAVSHEAAVALARAKEDGANVEAVRDDVQAIEHRGDALVHQLEEALAKTFVTPIDREDIQKLSKELDDVIDLTNGAARACVLFGVEQPTEPMGQLMDLLTVATRALRDALPNLRKHNYAALIETSRELRKLEKEGDQIFRSAISALFHDAEIDAKRLIREREVLEDLEHAIDYCEHVANTLAHLAVKHG